MNREVSVVLRVLSVLEHCIHANHYDFDIVFMLLNSNYAITIIILLTVCLVGGVA